MDRSFCDIVAEIQKDPFKKVEGLTVRVYLGLKEHIATCQKCNDAVDEIIEKGKDVPSKPDSSLYN